MGPIDWGDAPTWIAGSFAAVAAYYARATLQSQRQQIREQREFISEQAANLRLEREQLQAQLADRRSEQARHIRLRVTASGGYFNDESEQYEDPDRWTVTVENRSDAPVYEVSATFGGQPSEWVQTADRSGGSHAVPVLGREKDAVFTSPRFASTHLRAAMPVVRFRDANGAWWRMLHDERLVEIAAPRDASSE
ncbi:hypothetical protein [Streptomyces leeuwenhoekii]|uniref:hypothetical protein n=1 Tax=Streptomyces leeuwenhoekii TaxID=1437453 RepID=UPI00131CE6E2|nr:hypothetical protein [Streptomyces leeuwenhoekii]